MCCESLLKVIYLGLKSLQCIFKKKEKLAKCASRIPSLRTSTNSCFQEEKPLVTAGCGCPQLQAPELVDVDP
jgi:hypothetical protein